MQQTDIVPADIRVLSEQIYQYQKGVRQMVLCTFHKRHESLAIKKLNSQGIDYVIQPVGNGRINLYFGRKACVNTIQHLVKRPLRDLTPEEGFMLGALLGYDITMQWERYCKRKCSCNGNCKKCC